MLKKVIARQDLRSDASLVMDQTLSALQHLFRQPLSVDSTRSQLHTSCCNQRRQCPSSLDSLSIAPPPDQKIQNQSTVLVLCVRQPVAPINRMVQRLGL